MNAASVFRAQHARGVFPAGQLVVRRGGKVVADEALGATADTRFGVFSASKPFVAIACAILEDRGALDVDKPLSHFVPDWPKDRTVLDVLTHRSGIVLPEVVADEKKWGDREALLRAIATTPPRHARGVLAYGPYEFGWVLGEVIHRVAGTPLPSFLDEVLLKPAGIDVAFTTTGPVARSHWLGGKQVVAGVELSARWEEVHNAPSTHAALCPGAGLYATAGALAKFYELLLAGGGGFVKPETIARYTAALPLAYDRSNRMPLYVARGFLTGQPWPSLYGWWNTGTCYGHAGAFCAAAWADPVSGAAIAYVTNANRGPVELLRRTAPIGAAVRAG